MANIIDVVGREQFSKEVLQSDVPVLVDFWAPWCGPCRMLAPVITAVAEEMGDKVKFVKLNTEEGENGRISMEDYHVMGIPNIKIFKNGQVVKEIQGLDPYNMKAKVIGILNEVLNA